jgi:hypothetical protein
MRAAIPGPSNCITNRDEDRSWTEGIVDDTDRNSLSQPEQSRPRGRPAFSRESRNHRYRLVQALRSKTEPSARGNCVAMEDGLPGKAGSNLRLAGEHELPGTEGFYPTCPNRFDNAATKCRPFSIRPCVRGGGWRLLTERNRDKYDCR